MLEVYKNKILNGFEGLFTYLFTLAHIKTGEYTASIQTKSNAQLKSNQG